MGHTKVFVLVPPDTPEDQVANEADKLLHQFSRHEQADPYRQYYDSYWASRAKQSGITDPHELAATSTTAAGVDEEGRIFTLETENPHVRFDYTLVGLNYCGRWNDGEPACRFGRCGSTGFSEIECNVRRVADLPPDWSRAPIVTPDGELHDPGDDDWHGWHTWDAERRVLTRRSWDEWERWRAEQDAIDWEAEWAALRATIMTRYADHWIVLFDAHV